METRLKYFYNGYLDYESVNNFINFVNQFSSSEFILDFYFCSGGGTLENYNTLKNILENNSFSEVNIYNTYFVGSYAFLLFYYCENVNKYLMSDSMGMVHSVSINYEDREIKDDRSSMSFKKKQLDMDNIKLADDLKLQGVITNAEKTRFLKGQDIEFTNERMIKIMKNCKYGNFIY